MESLVFVKNVNIEEFAGHVFGVDLSIYNQPYYTTKNLLSRIVRRLSYHWDADAVAGEIKFRGEHRHIHATILFLTNDSELSEVEEKVNFRLGKKSSKCWYSCRVVRVYK